MQGSNTNWWGLGETNGNPAELAATGCTARHPVVTGKLASGWRYSPLARCAHIHSSATSAITPTKDLQFCLVREGPHARQNGLLVSNSPPCPPMPTVGQLCAQDARIAHTPRAIGVAHISITAMVKHHSGGAYLGSTGNPALLSIYSQLIG